MWEWQVWRCFDHVKETFQDKGWEYEQDGRFDTITRWCRSWQNLVTTASCSLSGIQTRASAGSSCATSHGEAWCTCGASKTYRRRRKPGRCSKATEPPYRRCPTLENARYTSCRSRRCCRRADPIRVSAPGTPILARDAAFTGPVQALLRAPIRAVGLRRRARKADLRRGTILPGIRSFSLAVHAAKVRMEHL